MTCRRKKGFASKDLVATIKHVGEFVVNHGNLRVRVGKHLRQLSCKTWLPEVKKKSATPQNWISPRKDGRKRGSSSPSS